MDTLAVAGRFDLTDAQWAALEPLLPQPSRSGRPSLWTKRQLIDGIRWRVRTAVPWRDIPTVYGSWAAVYGLFRRWQRAGLAEDTGSLSDQAHTHGSLAWVWEQRGNNQRALGHATHALRLFQALDQPVWEADMLNWMGWCLARMGHHEQARTHCEAALALFRRHHDTEGQADTLDSLGYLAHHAGHHDQALDYYQQAITLLRSLGHTYNEANVLQPLGQTHAALGHHDQARRAWQNALELYQVQQRTADAERIQQQLDELTGGQDKWPKLSDGES